MTIGRFLKAVAGGGALAALFVVGLVAATGSVAATSNIVGSLADSSGLVGQWHLDTTFLVSGTHIPATPDSSGNGLDARVASASSVAGRFGNAFELAPGATSGAFVLNPGSVLEPATVTVLAWVKRSGSPGNYKYIVAKGARACNAASYALETGPSGGLVFYVDDGGQARVSADAGQAAWDGKWHLIAGTYDGSGVRLYLDGSQVGSATSAGAIPYALATASSNLAIGDYPSSACGTAFQFAGDVDEVRVYSRALTASELAYLASATGQTPPELPAPVTTTTTTTTARTTTTTTAGTTTTTATSTGGATTTASSKVANTTAPQIVGKVQAGATVSCDPGVWTGSPALTYSWYWQQATRTPPFRVVAGGRSFGATKGSYFARTRTQVLVEAGTVGTTRTIVLHDLPAAGATLVCSATAKGSGGAVSALSKPLAFQTEPPALVRTGTSFQFVRPSITPTVGGGGTNTCRPGIWSHYPTFDYAWYQVLPKARNAVASSTRLLSKGQRYTLTPRDETTTVECVVTARNTAGSAEASSNAYVVPAGAPHSTQPPFVDVHSQGPKSDPGLVGPEGGTAVAEQIQLGCDDGRWDRGDLTYVTQWFALDANGDLGQQLGFGSTYSLDMRPGKLQSSGTVECVVTATTSHHVSGTARSGPIAVWNGCREWFETSGTTVNLGAVALEGAAIATGGAVALFGVAFGGAGFSPLASWNLEPGSSTVYTQGPNCLDYQRYYEGQGYTVKQVDG
jgi:Concanavalin A-like lectin/glucanases superfamily